MGGYEGIWVAVLPPWGRIWEDMKVGGGQFSRRGGGGYGRIWGYLGGSFTAGGGIREDMRAFGWQFYRRGVGGLSLLGEGGF